MGSAAQALNRSSFTTHYLGAPVQDPYANAFRMRWRPVSQHPKHERLIGRGGW